MTRRRKLIFIALASLFVPLLLGTASVLYRSKTLSPQLATRLGEMTPAARPPTTQRPLAVVLTGNYGTEVTDMLAPIEMLGASDAFEVRVVAPERRVSPFFNAGLDFVPDLGFADYDALVGRPPALIVVPYVLGWETRDAALVGWLRTHVGPRTTVLSICAGAELVAGAGLFDGHRATANLRGLAALEAKHPGVAWQHGVRWVHDDTRFSSGTLTAGVDATLAAISALAGRPAADRAIATTGYRNGRFLDDPHAPQHDRTLAIMLEAGFRWETQTIGVVLVDGVSESAVAGMVEAYTATITSSSVTLATTRTTVRTRNGVGLVPRRTLATLGDYDDVVELSAASSTYGYDAALAQVARTHGGPKARMAADMINYPAAHLSIPSGLPVGVSMVIRALVLALFVAAVLLMYAGSHGQCSRHDCACRPAEPPEAQGRIDARGCDGAA